jgi:hypothetical protein
MNARSEHGIDRIPVTLAQARVHWMSPTGRYCRNIILLKAMDPRLREDDGENIFPPLPAIPAGGGKICRVVSAGRQESRQLEMVTGKIVPLPPHLRPYAFYR